VYGIVGRYYRPLGIPAERPRTTPVNYLAAATFVPIRLAGAPLLMSLLSCLGTSGLSKVVSRSVTRADLQTAAGSCAPPVPQEGPEGQEC
jgi:hypothetical protein